MGNRNLNWPASVAVLSALALVANVVLLPTAAIAVFIVDWRLGLMCLVAFPILVGLAAWFRAESAKTYREVRDSAALVIVQFVETMTGIKAVQAYRREPRNQEIFEGLTDRYRDVNGDRYGNSYDSTQPNAGG